jgi:hypothetical protein
VWAGRLSREILDSRVLTLSNEAEGHVHGGVIASRRGTLRGQRTWARTEVSMRENREVRVSRTQKEADVGSGF